MRRHVLVPVVLTVGLGVLAAGCGASATKAAPGSTVVTVTLTNAGCTLDRSAVPAGPVTFEVANAGSGAVTEAELLSGPSILAERENVAAGFKASFAYDVTVGSYAINCPGGSGASKVPLTVTPGKDAAAPASGTVVADALSNADTGYVGYVTGQVALLQSTAKTFTDAVRAGDLAAAEKAYPVARVYYERIEPVAESFGDLDPMIDNRIDDVGGSLAKLTGFHRLEYAMYVAKSLTGMTPVADQLDANIARLKALVPTLKVQPAFLANGATSLLDEVGKSKITGEEERYSHIDLVDFVANVAGSEEAYDLLRPALQQLQPNLVTQLDTRFAALDKALAAYSTGPAPSDYVRYSTIPTSVHPYLSQLVDALAAPLSQVAGVVVTS